MVDEVWKTSKTDEWATPQQFFACLDAEFHFTLDPCANHVNHKCTKYYTKADNGLSKSWGGKLFSATLHTAGKLANG